MPAGGAQRRDDAWQVEGAFAAQAASVDGVLEERPYRFGVGVVEFDADDVAQRYGGEVGRWRVRPFGVPDVDEKAPGCAVGVLDEFESVVHRFDVGPGQELETYLGAGVAGLGGKRGELGDPAVVV